MLVNVLMFPLIEVVCLLHLQNQKTDIYVEKP